MLKMQTFLLDIAVITLSQFKKLLEIYLLITERQYVTEINDTIQRVKEQYAVMVYNRQQLQHERTCSSQYQISCSQMCYCQLASRCFEPSQPQRITSGLRCAINGNQKKTIAYSSKKKKYRKRTKARKRGIELGEQNQSVRRRDQIVAGEKKRQLS